MDIKPAVSPVPIVQSGDHTSIDAAQEKKTQEQQQIATPVNNETGIHTARAMKHAPTEMKGSMETSGHFLQQTLTNQLMHPDAKDADKVRNLIHKLQQTTGDELIQP